jgi:hypothetical protein
MVTSCRDRANPCDGERYQSAALRFVTVHTALTSEMGRFVPRYASRVVNIERAAFRLADSVGYHDGEQPRKAT